MVSDIKLLRNNTHTKSSVSLDNEIFSAIYGKDQVPDDNTYDRLVNDLDDDHQDVELVRLEDKC